MSNMARCKICHDLFDVGVLKGRAREYCSDKCRIEGKKIIKHCSNLKRTARNRRMAAMENSTYYHILKREAERDPENYKKRLEEYVNQDIRLFIDYD